MGLTQTRYLCSRELTALHWVLQGRGENVPAVQSWVAVSGDLVPHAPGFGSGSVRVWIQDDLLCFAELLLIFSHFYSADCHGNATASCGFSDGWAALAVLDQEMLLWGKARAMAFGREVAAQCPTSGPACGFSLWSEPELAATPDQLSTAGSQTRHTNLSRKGFKCILGALKLLSRERTAQNLVS